MWETLLIAALTGGFTLAGVWLAQRAAGKQAEASRRDDQRREVRALVAEFVHSGVQWAQGNLAIVPAAFRAVTTDSNFWIEFVDTDSGKALREYSLSIQRSASELRLVVSDAVLLDLVSAALASISDADAMNELFKEAKNPMGRDAEVIGAAWRHFDAVQDAFRAVESRAGELLRGKP